MALKDVIINIGIAFVILIFGIGIIGILFELIYDDLEEKFDKKKVDE